MQKVRLAISLFIITFLASCKGITQLVNYSRWNVDYKFSTSIITHPAQDENKTVYVSVSNASYEQNALQNIEMRVKYEFFKKHFNVVSNPRLAKYRVIANVRLFRKIPFRDFENIQENWNMELSDNIASENLLRQRNISKIENEIAKYTSQDGPATLKLHLDERETKHNRTIGQIMEAYKNFDLSGIILGSTVGFLTESPKNVILGGIFGGFIFEVFARITEPNTYLLVIDLEISEPRCISFDGSINDTRARKTCAIVREEDRRIYRQDDYSYRAMSFSRRNDYITYRTTIYATSSKIFAPRHSSISNILAPLPAIIASQVR